MDRVDQFLFPDCHTVAITCLNDTARRTPPESRGPLQAVANLQHQRSPRESSGHLCGYSVIRNDAPQSAMRRSTSFESP